MCFVPHHEFAVSLTTTCAINLKFFHQQKRKLFSVSWGAKHFLFHHQNYDSRALLLERHIKSDAKEKWIFRAATKHKKFLISLKAKAIREFMRFFVVSIEAGAERREIVITWHREAMLCCAMLWWAQSYVLLTPLYRHETLRKCHISQSHRNYEFIWNGQHEKSNFAPALTSTAAGHARASLSH